MSDYHRQAVVVVHGMGEQRPVETLNAFSEVIGRDATFHSRSTKYEGEFEARRHIVPPRPRATDQGPGDGFNVQTEIFEYHWAHLMQGNRLNDLWPTFRRIMLPATTTLQTVVAVALLLIVAASVAACLSLGPDAEPPWLFPALVTVAIVAALAFLGSQLPLVPPGIRGLWIVIWLAVGGLVWAFLAIPNFSELIQVPPWVQVAAGSVSAIAIVAYAASRLLPGWLVKYMVDVVRYLDTSPRSFAVRRQIRAGIVELLSELQDSGKYSRIVVTGHSLGSYIAYDAISYLWSVSQNPTVDGDALAAVERAASALVKGTGDVDEYQRAQRELWRSLRRSKQPWLITDFVSFGSPMNFADRIYTRNRTEFADRMRRRELVSCPPISEQQSRKDLAGAVPGKPLANVNRQDQFFSYLRLRPKQGWVRYLHEASPFAVVRWTNMWYPAVGSFFGDWFGGPLAPLYGPGVRDVKLTGDGGRSRIPGYAHGVYVTTRNYDGDLAFAREFRKALDLDSAAWLAEDPEAPDEPRTRIRARARALDGQASANGDG